MFSYHDQQARSEDYLRYARRFIQRERLAKIVRSASPRRKGLITRMLSLYRGLVSKKQSGNEIELKSIQHRSTQAQ